MLENTRLNFPFDCESPFLFAAYHKDVYPAGDESMGPDRKLLASRALGADFGHPSGWNMYHGERVPGFPKHPHRGFETLTVMRHGLVDHTDSLGNSGRYGDGDVQWMTAGRGISHSEMFPLLNRDGENKLEAFQIWINLPKKSKMAAPNCKMFWREDIPAAPALGAGVEVALIVGELTGFDMPPSPPPDSYASDPSSDMLVLTVKLAKGTSWTLPGFKGAGSKSQLYRNVYLYTDAGCIVDGQCVPGKRHLKVRPEADLVIASENDVVEFLVMQGRDIGEPVVQHGPFVGNTKEDISKAFRDYQSTGFGNWPWPSDAIVHARERPRFALYSDGHLEEKPL